MDRPLYSNAFSVSYNQQIGEFILSFAMEYPKMVGLNDNRSTPAQFETIREDVCSLALPQATAIQLIEIIKQSLAGEQRDE